LALSGEQRSQANGDDSGLTTPFSKILPRPEGEHDDLEIPAKHLGISSDVPLGAKILMALTKAQQ
jgi:hypothetical protein